LGIPALLVVGESSFVFVRLFVANRRLYSFGCDLFCCFDELCCYGVWLRCFVPLLCCWVVTVFRSVVMLLGCYGVSFRCWVVTVFVPLLCCCRLLRCLTIVICCNLYCSVLLLHDIFVRQLCRLGCCWQQRCSCCYRYQLFAMLSSCACCVR